MYGNFGIGTFSGLDGEMVEPDGVVYHIKVDELAYPANDSTTTPFDAVTFFEADTEGSIAEPINRSQTEEYIKELMREQKIRELIFKDH